MRILSIYPRSPTFDQFCIHVHAIHIHPPNCAAILVRILHHYPDLLAECKVGQRLLGVLAIRLLALGGVDFGQPALSGVSIDIDAGEFVALMGANGTGKTTLVRAILGLLRPDHGQAWLFDTPTERFREWSRVAYVPQRLLAATAVGLLGKESDILRRVLKWSLGLLLALCVLVYLQSNVLSWMLP